MGDDWPDAALGADETPTRSVLIVEDEENIATALAYLLGRQGYASRHVCDGQAALSEITANPPDLVLLDIMLPRRTGYEVCAEIRSDPAFADTKILLMTASGGRETMAYGSLLGADGFIAKPFSTADLKKEVARLLAK